MVSVSHSHIYKDLSRLTRAQTGQLLATHWYDTPPAPQPATSRTNRICPASERGRAGPPSSQADRGGAPDDGGTVRTRSAGTTFRAAKKAITRGCVGRDAPGQEAGAAKNVNRRTRSTAEAAFRSCAAHSLSHSLEFSRTLSARHDGIAVHARRTPTWSAFS